MQTSATDITEPDIYAGGDPVMGSMAVGHDYVDTTEAQTEIEDAESQKGTPLTPDETRAILARHPAADQSLATGPQKTRAFGRWIASLPKSFLFAIPWWIWAIIALALAIVFAPYARIFSKLLPERKD